MNQSGLPAIQKPLKEMYKAQPKSAELTLRAQGRLGKNIGCSVKYGDTLIEARLPKALGGDSTNVCPGDIYLGSIVACFGVTLRAVAAHMGLSIQDGTVHVEGDLDVRGTLGVSENVPVGFQRIRVAVELDTTASDEEIRTLVALAEKYAVVVQTQIASPVLSITHSRITR